MTDLDVACRCGKVHGRLREASPTSVNRVVCYCDDCQAFARHLGREDLMDAAGGSDIVQLAPARLSFDAGLDELECLRLRPKGLFRWYARCCKTPLGNTLSPRIPFVGVVTAAFAGADVDRVFGAPRARLLTKFATGTPPSQARDAGLPFMARTLRLILGWKLTGRGSPHPFFGRDGRPIREPRVLG